MTNPRSTDRRIRVLSVVGARPNFVKMAPILNAFAKKSDALESLLVHTGQHYDVKMSDRFFKDLDMKEPDFHLGAGGGGHAEQTGKVMVEIERVMLDVQPDLVLVVGDVNSTLASAVTAKKLNIAVAHVEAGLRSGDRSMPEEINRLATDAISDLLFTTDRQADETLTREGVASGRIHFVGNVMIDALMKAIESAKRLNIGPSLGVERRGYGVLTLHRPSNVDDRDRLVEILDAIADGTRNLPVIFPVHPRTRSRLEAFGLMQAFDERWRQLRLTEPLGYLDLLSLNEGAKIVLTDSGGVQEETTVLGVPCVTLRENTERPVTITEGTNHLAGVHRLGILSAIDAALAMPHGSRRPERWDGLTAERIADVIIANRTLIMGGRDGA